MTTDILPQYRAYQDQIDQLNKKLANTYTPGVEGGYIGDGSGGYDSVQNVASPMNTPGSGGRFATIGDAYVDFLEKEGVVFKDSAVNSNARMVSIHLIRTRYHGRQSRRSANG